MVRFRLAALAAFLTFLLAADFCVLEIIINSPFWYNIAHASSLERNTFHIPICRWLRSTMRWRNIK